MVLYQQSTSSTNGFRRIVVASKPMRRRHTNVPPFGYMAWAKTVSQAAPRYHLGQSGLAPPAPAELSLAGLETDLAQRGHDMPPALRHGLADWWQVAPEALMLTLGTSHAFYLLCAAMLERGDTVLVEQPCYEMLHRLPALFGARVERFERPYDPDRRDDGWGLGDLCARIARLGPAMVLLSNPHNPSGRWLERAALGPVADACAAAGALLCVDEVYLPFLPDAPAESAHALGPHVAIASSFTKAFGLGTVRCGWLVAAPDIVARAIAYNNYINVLFPNPSAWVGLRALAAREALTERAQRIRARGIAVVDAWIAGRSDVHWHRPAAGVVGFPRLTKLDDTRGFSDALLRAHDTVLVPGAFFEAPGHVRLGFGNDPDALAAGLERVGTALDGL